MLESCEGLCRVRRQRVVTGVLAGAVTVFILLSLQGGLPEGPVPAGNQRTEGGRGGGGKEEDCETCDDKAALTLDTDLRANTVHERHLGQDRVALYRHYHGHLPWPQIQPDITLPGQMPPTLHYLWCKGGFSMGLHHYLGVLSALRLLQPSKVVLHFDLLPRLDHDMYYTWFLELKQSLPNLVLRVLPQASPPCGSLQMLDLALSFLQQDGGIFLGSNVIISRVPRDIALRPFWFAFSPNNRTDKDTLRLLDNLDVTRGVIIAKEGFDDAKKTAYTNQILKSRPECISPEEFDAHAPDSEENARCVVVRDKPDIYPVRIMYANSSFGQLARWMYYGTRAPLYPNTAEGDPIPRISHLIWFSPSRNEPHTMEFYQFLTVLSALYVGGFHHVYIHGNAGFVGPWWKSLKTENVTFVRLDDPEMVYQQMVNNPSHKSDVTRYAILHKYGGAYHDFEAMWTMRVPDWLLQYPCVATSDWAAYGEFPDGINPGVLLAKCHAPWLRYNLAAHRYYVEENFVWNAVLMSYRTYERHPDQLLFYRHLQVMCDMGTCHPSWEDGFRRDINDHSPTLAFDWRTETLVVHVTRPDPETSFVSPKALKEGKDMFAEIGRNILQKSGRFSLLQEGR
ncbi:hypothetical protein ACOMHN_060015 [Nucella lapillus]